MSLRTRTPLRCKTPLRRKTPLRSSRTPLAKRGRVKARREKAYREHMKSKYWQTLKALAYQRDRGICQQCGLKVGKGWHLAHRTNKRFGHEWLTDVEVNCPECNLAERASRAWYAGPIQSNSKETS